MGNMPKYKEDKLHAVAAEVQAWDFIASLPQQIDGFAKVIDGDTLGQVLHICHYENKEHRLMARIIYTVETEDYILTQQYGLNHFRDMRFIYRDRELFARTVGDKLEQVLDLMLHPEHRNLGELVAEKELTTWEFGNNLPEQIGNFVRYLRPADTFEYLNGSVIFLDYSNFANSDQLVFYYNCLRDQFFAEIKVGGVFEDTKAFDSRDLTLLEQELKEHLTEVLDYIEHSDGKL